MHLSLTRKELLALVLLLPSCTYSFTSPSISKSRTLLSGTDRNISRGNGWKSTNIRRPFKCSVRSKTFSIGVAAPEASTLDGGIGGQESNDASTTPELLVALWEMITYAESSMGKNEQKTILFPNMQDKLSNQTFLQRLVNHLDTCKDVCDEFGISVLLLPNVGNVGIDDANADKTNMAITGFTVKSYRDPSSLNDSDGELDETGGYKFQNDNFWDDDFDFEIDPALLEADDDEEYKSSIIEKELPSDEGVTDDDMIEVSKRWVDTMMSNMGICPFTSGPDMAGLPLGKVFYTVDRLSTVEEAYLSYWRELVRLENTNERELSTTLLIMPNFSISNVELFESFSTTLTQPLEPLDLEKITQLVFFHPRWSFRESSGIDRTSGAGHAANYARRSPWPMINLLRTSQVRTAQKGIPTGLVYTQNEKTLSSIGSRDLEDMLISRDWDPLKGKKVNRKEHDALSLALDMQDGKSFGGKYDPDNNSFVTKRIGKSDLVSGDANVAANSVDKSKMEQGDMVTIIMQAVEKRIEDGKLGGPETSATLLAADFLLQELTQIMDL